jgi:hypothetical protein
MSENPVDARSDQITGAKELLARAAAAESRAHHALSVAIGDFFLPDADRLDERTRVSLGELLAMLINTLEGEVREHGARLLAARGQARLAGVLAEPGESVAARLQRSGVLRDGALMGELLARVRHEALGASLPMHVPDDPERPSLINRFVQHPDRVLATGAMAVLIAKSRRRGGPDSRHASHTDLPAELHHRLVWWVAAALRERAAEGCEAIAELDRALCDAAQRSLAAYDEGDRLEAAAMRFAAAIDAQSSEVPDLLVESLGDRRIVLFTALLANALGMPYELARQIVLDPGADRLWLALRALDLPRDAIAQIGYALSEADPRRDLESFADMLDAIADIGVVEARDSLAALKLHPDYRAALLALEGSA